MGFLEGNYCPHYDEEPQRRPSVKKFLEEGTFNSCYASEGNAALHVKNDNDFISVDFGDDKNSYDFIIQNLRSTKGFTKVSIRP